MSTRLLAAILALTQVPGVISQPRAAFEVVSVKRTPPDRDDLYGNYCAQGSRFTTRGTPLLYSLAWAYGVNKDRIEKEPNWLSSFRTYDIEATAFGPITRADCQLMVQALFAERFQLRMHKETRMVPVFELVIAKSGPKLTSRDRVTINGAVKQVTTEAGEPIGWTMARLANYVSSDRSVQRPVIDKTALDGTYGFTLSYSQSDSDDRPDIFSALPDQIGLRLQAARGPVEVWVIDHIARPEQN